MVLVYIIYSSVFLPSFFLFQSKNNIKNNDPLHKSEEESTKKERKTHNTKYKYDMIYSTGKDR